MRITQWTSYFGEHVVCDNKVNHENFDNQCIKKILPQPPTVSSLRKETLQHVYTAKVYICFILSLDFKSIFYKYFNRSTEKEYGPKYPTFFSRGRGGNLPPTLIASYDKLHISIVHQGYGSNLVAFILRTFSLIYNL